MQLHELTPSKGRATKKKQRVGRGNSSNYGNYCGRGRTGQRSRAGFSQHPAFEGGQTPFFMRMPKRRGFKRYFKLLNPAAVINLARLQKDDKVTDGMTITKQQLLDLNYTKKIDTPVKILGQGELTKKLTFGADIDKISKTAVQKITAAGGTIDTPAAT